MVAERYVVRFSRVPAFVVAVSLLVTACFDGASDAGAPDPTAGDDLAFTDIEPGERPCEGGAFPDDDEFHELLCDVQWTYMDAVNAGVGDPEWQPRISEAILGYGDDRDASVAQLAAVLAEMRDALGDS